MLVPITARMVSSVSSTSSNCHVDSIAAPPAKKIRIVSADVVRIIRSFLGWRALSMSITSTPPGPPLSGPPPDNLWPLSVERYHQMIDAGILTTDDPVELLDGYLVRKMPKHAMHRFVTDELRDWFNSVLPAGYHTMAQ